MYVRIAFSLSSCLCPPNPRVIGIALFCLVLFSVGCQRFLQSLVSSFLAPSPLSQVSQAYKLPKSLALTAITRVERVASSVISCLFWCLEQFVDCVFSTPSSLNLVIISTSLRWLQYTHLLHAQDLGFMEAGYQCRPMTELVCNAGHVILLPRSSNSNKHHVW